jgi:arylsulfatase A-like enzyme
MGFIAPGDRFGSPAFACTAVALTSLLTLGLFLAVRWLLVAPLARRSRDVDALSVATAVGVVVLLVAHDVDSPHTGQTRLFELFVDFSLAVVAGAGSFALALNDARQPGTMTPLRLFGRTLPFAMPLALVAAWVVFVGLEDVTTIGAVLSLLGLASGVTACARFAARAPSARWRYAVAGTNTLVIALGIGGLIAIEAAQGLPVIDGTARAHGKFRHVILLTVDTLRRDNLSCYGSRTVSTPNIDRIAADGCLFRNVTASSSWTEPSFASMMTGLPTAAHRVVNAAAVLPDTVETLAERFQKAGYATYAAVANGMLAPHRGFAQGFDGYDLREVHHAPVCVGEWLAVRFERHPVEDETSTRDVTDLAISWSVAHKDRPSFLWLHYYDPHLPYKPPESFVQRMNIHDSMGFSLGITSLTRPTMDLFGTAAERAWARSLYDAETRYVDSEVGRFLDALRSSGIYEDALIVFAVDHGEEFWDHDGFEHGHTLYHELVGVPLMIKLPAPHQARVVNAAVSGYDVTPTVLELCGLPPVTVPAAISLAGYVTGAAARPADRPLFSGGTLFRSSFESVVFEGWKYIRSTTTGRELLFRLPEDPRENRSLALQQPAVTARGRALLDEHTRAMEAFREEHGIVNPIIQLDAEEVERLRTLGYL